MKKKMIKTIQIMMVLAVFAIMAMGSGSSDSDTKKKIADASSEPLVSGQDTAQAEEGETSEQSESVDVELPTIEEQVLLDQDGVKITATEMVNDDIWGEGVKLLIENNMGKTVDVGCNALIVNDYMITDLFSSTVADGKKANEVMYISSSELEAADIDNIGQIEIYFHIYDDDTYDTILDADCVTIKTSVFDQMDTSADDEGKELFNQDGIRIIGKYVDEDSFWGASVLLYIENTSGKKVGISCDNMSINGFMMTPYFATTVYDGKKALDSIEIMSSDLEDNGIESVDDVELQFHIYDDDTYDTIVDTDAIKFSTK